jgi:hypothetical protein
MRAMNLVLARYAAATILIAGMVAARASAELRAGAARVDITPNVGVSLDGPISKNGPVTTVHDPLHARALVLDDGTTRLAIVVVDQCMTGRDVFDAAKEQVHRETGLPVDRMLMAATHTHAAPRTTHIGRSKQDDQYHDYLAQRIAVAVNRAQQNLVAAKIGYASFDRSDLIACRRFLCQPGSVAKNPFGIAGERIKSVAGSSSQVIEPAGPVDGQFSVLSIQTAASQPLCLLGNFSVHYAGGYQRGAVSADYFGQFAKAVERKLGNESSQPAVVAIMSNGTSGDTGSFRLGEIKKYPPFQKMAFFGRLLADQAVAAAANISYRRDVSLAMVESELELAVRRPDDQRLRWAEKVIAHPDDPQPHRWSRVYATEAQHLANYPDTIKLKLQAIRIGDVAIAAAPCEVFAATGLAIKKASPIKHTFNMELANGYGGYLPSGRQHELGGYETWPARSSLLEVDAEEKIRSQLIGLLRSLQPRPALQPRPVDQVLRPDKGSPYD